MIERANELRKSIQDKWDALDKVRILGGSGEVLSSIRRKLYEQQDELIELIAKNDIKLTGDILLPKKKALHYSREKEPSA